VKVGLAVGYWDVPGVGIPKRDVENFLQQNELMPICLFAGTEIEFVYEQTCKGNEVPTVLREGPYRFYWYSHEPGEPPYVHVDRDQCSAKFWLNTSWLARNIGFPRHELRQICSIIENNQSTLLEAWHGYFGN